MRYQLIIFSSLCWVCFEICYIISKEFGCAEKDDTTQNTLTNACAWYLFSSLHCNEMTYYKIGFVQSSPPANYIVKSWNMLFKWSARKKEGAAIANRIAKSNKAGWETWTLLAFPTKILSISIDVAKRIYVTGVYILLRVPC